MQDIKPKFEKFEKNIKNIIEQKIQAILFIPEGDKTIIWFTFKDNKPVCIHLTKNMEYLSTLFVSFDKDCCFNGGTFFYGIMMKKENIFCIEDCLLFAGKRITNYLESLKMTHQFLHNYTNNISFFSQQTIFSIPLIISNIYDKIDYSLLKYKIKYIQFRCGIYGNNIYYNTHYSFFSANNKIIKEFEIISDNKLPDIYKIKENGELLLIPDYKTSVEMNTLFNKNKIGYNLDLLEESDSEENYEKEEEYLKINCYYNNRFKKWIPQIKNKDKIK